MPEVPDLCEYHGNAVIISNLDRLIVANRPAGLNDRRDPGLDGALNAIRKDKEPNDETREG